MWTDIISTKEANNRSHVFDKLKKVPWPKTLLDRINQVEGLKSENMPLSRTRKASKLI